MLGIAATVDFSRPEKDSLAVASLLRALRRGTTETAVTALEFCALGVTRGASVERAKPLVGRGLVQPFVDERLGVAVVADIRLDNRRDLAIELGLRPEETSAAEILAFGYERWGSELADRLIGDFAFCLWDSNRRRLYAARDPFGGKPLFYSRRNHGCWLASEVEALLLQPELNQEINPSVVLDFLLARYRHYRETFYREIFRLLPGHFLIAQQGDCREVRYWHPPGNPFSGSRDQANEEFRRLFRNAVANRLPEGQPVLIQLSGGLDSSSIACAANEIYRTEPSPPSRVVLTSAVYPGMDCDESPFINLIADSTKLPSQRWASNEVAPGTNEAQLLGYPWRNPNPSGSSRAFEIARSLGSETVLSGFGGDQLLFERGIFADLALDARWLRLLRETLLAPNFYSASGRLHFFTDALRTWAGPRLRGAYRRLLPRTHSAPPSWLAPPMHALFVSPEERSPFEAPETIWGGHTQRFTWNWLTSADQIWNTELQELEAARAGIELRHPFLDRRLAQFILSLPYQHRLPGGMMKRILRESMKDTLPNRVRWRSKPTTFDRLFCSEMRTKADRIRAILDRPVWRCAPYVVKNSTTALFNDLCHSRKGASEWRSWFSLWNIAMLEEWLNTQTLLASSQRS
jgi:asparagine synthase (glutamine-hydrolysing)